MYLTRMLLDTSRRATMKALTNRTQLHGAVESAFSGPRQHTLWRLDTLRGNQYLMILSCEKPNLTVAVEQFGDRTAAWESKDYGPLLERVKAGTIWRFRLTANPTYSKPLPGGKRGEVCAHITPEHQCQWLEAQAAHHGFAVERDQFNVMRSEWLQFYKGTDKNRKVTLLSVTFEGILTVTDEALFREALCGGIGRGKAYGMGLMTLVRCDG